MTNCKFKTAAIFRKLSNVGGYLADKIRETLPCVNPVASAISFCVTPLNSAYCLTNSISILRANSDGSPASMLLLGVNSFIRSQIQLVMRQRNRFQDCLIWYHNDSLQGLSCCRSPNRRIGLNSPNRLEPGYLLRVRSVQGEPRQAIV